MPGHIEPADFILRVGQHCHAIYDPYTWFTACRYTTSDRTEVKILGAERAPIFSERRDIREVLWREGILRAYYVRIEKDGSERRIELTR
jgi:hypothetical protein